MSEVRKQIVGARRHSHIMCKMALTIWVAFGPDTSFLGASSLLQTAMGTKRWHRKFGLLGSLLVTLLNW